MFDRIFRRRPSEPGPEPATIEPPAVEDVAVEAPAVADPTVQRSGAPPVAEVSVVEAAAEAADAPARGGLLGRFRKLAESVERTRDAWFYRIDRILDQRTISEAFYDELEEILIQADVGVDTAEKIIAALRARVRGDNIRVAADARAALKSIMVGMLPNVPYRVPEARPAVILVVGVNGVGKTTSIAKLARYLRGQRKRVLLAAGDTFRAAAIDQLKVWGERVGVDVVAHQPGADPGAVVYDALQAAQGREMDVLIIDTAGRLHTKFNLMEELRKIKRVLQKADPGAPHQVLLVMDATTGQNGLAQARHFTEATGVDGIVLAKLDGTAKGGIVFAIADHLKLPIQFVGSGEKLDDLAEFDPEQFVEALLG